jgi:hypothetical protein
VNSDGCTTGSSCCKATALIKAAITTVPGSTSTNDKSRINAECSLASEMSKGNESDSCLRLLGEYRYVVRYTEGRLTNLDEFDTR